jgi:hypothetical protein
MGLIKAPMLVEELGMGMRILKGPDILPENVQLYDNDV